MMHFKERIQFLQKKTKKNKKRETETITCTINVRESELTKNKILYTKNKILYTIISQSDVIFIFLHY